MLEKLKKPQLIAKVRLLMDRLAQLQAAQSQREKRAADYEALVQEKDRLVQKTTEVLKKVAAWENNKQVVLADARDRLEQEQRKLKKTVADVCIFMETLKTGLDAATSELVAQKIKAIENSENLERITTEVFDPALHIPLSVTGDGTRVDRYVTPGYKYQGRPLILAKVILNSK